MSNFLTVIEAAKLTGKSPSSIRRILYPILKSDKHPDRQHIEPNVAMAKSMRVKGENFAWKVSEELLRREIPEGEEKAKVEPKVAPIGGDHLHAFIEMLQKELDIKNRQIETQSELLKGFSERLREGNILIGSLQKQLALGDGSDRNRSDTVEVDSSSMPTAETPKQGSNESASSTKTTDVSNTKSKVPLNKMTDTLAEPPKKKTHWLFPKIF